MIRIRGFARKTRRLTKGGSLPDSGGNNPATGPLQSDQTISSGLTSTMGSNGHHNNGNGAESQVVSRTQHERPSATGIDRQNGAADNGITSFLHKAVTRLVPSPAADSPAIGTNGSLAPVEKVSELQTVIARARDSISVHGKPLPAWKRALDLTLIIATAPLWFPLLLLVMAWIRAVSPGPIFYRQERVGYRRNRFMIFKFRTMHVNAETRSHEEYFAQLITLDCPMTKLDCIDDNRLIRCGRLLRAIGLDELPQIFNVLRGEMSLVGPRPCLPNEFTRYQPSQQERVNTPPGLTGYWQVNGKNKTTFSEMIAMDIFYAENMSLWLDVKIILKTIPALIGQAIESRRSALDTAKTPAVPRTALNALSKRV